MATVYILYSKSIDKFYIGSCRNLEQRLEEHKNNEFPKGFIRRASDWGLFFKIDELEYRQAHRIERHIKLMKNRKYIQNLPIYPEITKKLIAQYK